MKKVSDLGESLFAFGLSPTMARVYPQKKIKSRIGKIGEGRLI